MMENITILGAGVSGIELARKIREKGSNCEITLIDSNTCYLPRKELIASPGDISKRQDIASIAKSLKAVFINGLVERINPRRKKIYFKDKEPLSFDNLVVATGLSSEKIEAKGGHREGFFYLSGMDPFKLKDLLRISEEATVYVTTRLGIKLAFALSSLGKEVRVVSGSLDFLAEEKQKIMDQMQDKNISLHLGSFIEEAVGESMIKAVKISPLKVFSSQLVFVDSAYKPKLDFFEEEVKIHDIFFTDFEGIYLLADAAKQDMQGETLFASNFEVARRQAEVFAEFVASGKPPVLAVKQQLPQQEETKQEDTLSEETQVEA